MNPTSGAPELTGQGQPTWEVAHLFPNQGQWTEAEYLALDSNHLIEFSDGFVEFLPMPTSIHQAIVFYLARVLAGFCEELDLGRVLLAPLPVRLWPGKIREPDVVFMLKANLARARNACWEGADLVMEVISEDRKRDIETKYEEYAQAGIAEYWLVDPLNSQITVYRLDGGRYVVHGQFSSGENATSVLLPGFSVEVSAVFAAWE